MSQDNAPKIRVILTLDVSQPCHHKRTTTIAFKTYHWCSNPDDKEWNIDRMNRPCLGDLTKRPSWCPLIEVEDMPHPAEDRPDCVGITFPKCYNEKRVR